MTESERENLSWDTFGSASRSLATDVFVSGYRPDVVVAIARGGLLLAGAVAYALDVKSCGALNVEFYTGVDERLPEPVVLGPHFDHDQLASQRVLLVDDVSDSGRTLTMVRDLLHATGAEVRTLCLYSKPGTVAEPDYIWRVTDRWINFPWSVQAPVSLA